MTYNIHYNEADQVTEDHRAIKDLEEWFGPEKTKVIREVLSKCETYHDLDGVNFSICMGGVTGRPVLALFRSYFGFEAIEEWSSKVSWDPKVRIKGV